MRGWLIAGGVSLAAILLGLAMRGASSPYGSLPITRERAEDIARAALHERGVTLPPKWRVPNDYAAVRRAANTGKPLISEKSPMSQMIYQMARAACGKPPANEMTSGCSVTFRISRIAETPIPASRRANG